jgi:Na+(H+)/acetate symporter ActP
VNKRGYTWWQYVGAAILILVTLVIAVVILRRITGQSFSLIDKIFGIR